MPHCKLFLSSFLFNSFFLFWSRGGVLLFFKVSPASTLLYSKQLEIFFVLGICQRVLLLSVLINLLVGQEWIGKGTGGTFFFFFPFHLWDGADPGTWLLLSPLSCRIYRFRTFFFTQYGKVARFAWRQMPEGRQVEHSISDVMTYTIHILSAVVL